MKYLQTRLDKSDALHYKLRRPLTMFKTALKWQLRAELVEQLTNKLAEQLYEQVYLRFWGLRSL